MKIEIKIPTMGESIVQATIGTLIKPSGARVSVDDELVELETDKVNQVLYASDAGVVTWNVAQSAVVKIGQTIGFIDTAQAALASPSKGTTPPTKEVPIPSKESPEKPISPQEPAISPSPTFEGAFKEGARKTKESFISELIAPPLQELPLPSAIGAQLKPVSPASKIERGETRKKMSTIRKVIASRLVDVLQQTAMLTTFNEVDMTKIIAMRETYKEAFNKQFNTRLGYMPFFVKAAVSAMKAFPEVNAYIDGEEIVYRDYYNISIAIGTDRGVIVPVVRECDKLSFADIERSIENFAKLVREGGLTPDALQGGGFTITNGGTYGSLLSTPILNPPQSAILGMHKIMKRPVVVNDEIVIREMMYLALSYDHRLIDGREAVSFLVHIKNNLEDPSRQLLGL